MVKSIDKKHLLLRLLAMTASVTCSECVPPLSTMQNQNKMPKAFCLHDDKRKFRKHTGSRKRKGRRYTVDSGASVHCINDKSMFDSIYEHHPTVRITVANRQVIEAEAVGTATLQVKNAQGVYKSITLHNVVYHPSFSENLLSVSRLWKDNRIATSFTDKCRLRDMVTGDKFAFEPLKHQYETPVLRAKVHLDPHLIHSRFGHCSERRLNKLRDRCINFPAFPHEKSIIHDPSTCDACQRGGMKRKPSGKRPQGRYTYFGEKLSSDLCEFPKSLEGYKYVLCIVDAHTNWLTTVPLKSKAADEVKESFEAFMLKYAHLLPTDKPVTWHTDNGGEFMSTDLHEFCQEFCVHRSFSVPYESPTNAHAERMWGILLRTTRVLLVQSGIHISSRPEGV